MTIIQDLYSIFDKYYAKNLKKQVLKDSVEIEIAQNLEFLREALTEQLSTEKIVSDLEDKFFFESIESGFDFNSLQKSRLSDKTIGEIKEFKHYQDWTTEKLIKKIYQRIAVIKKLNESDKSVDISRRLQNLFKLMLLTTAHINRDSLAYIKTTKNKQTKQTPKQS